MAGREDEAQRKEDRDSESKQSWSPLTQAGESRGGDVPGVRRRSETASKSQSAPQDPRSWGLGGEGELCTQKKG